MTTGRLPDCTWHYSAPEGILACILDAGHPEAHTANGRTWLAGDEQAWQAPPNGHPHSPSDVTPPGSTRLKWLQTRLNVASGKTRDAGRAVLQVAEGAGGPAAVAEIAEHLHRLLDETERWKDAWASEHADRDRQARRAASLAGDCDAHGQAIRDLHAQLQVETVAHARTEAARLVLLGWLDACDKFVSTADARAAARQPRPSVDAVLSWMRRQLPKVHAAHQRAWRKPERTADR